jgi:hypothetical protein
MQIPVCSVSLEVATVVVSVADRSKAGSGTQIPLAAAAVVEEGEDIDQPSLNTTTMKTKTHMTTMITHHP